MMKRCVFIFLVIVSVNGLLPSTQLILNWGYPCEEHLANTQDGWVLTLQRIPLEQGTPKGIVFFQHGLLDWSAGVLLNGPGLALPFILSDNGYEVWLGNNRGNGNSMTNLYFNSTEAGFWNFTFDDFAKYDVPTQVDYVLGYTGVKSLTYIGHSQGTIQAFAGFLYPAFNASAKINLFVALAPVAWVANMQSPVFVALADVDLDVIFQLLGIQEFALPQAIEAFTPTLCGIDTSACDLVIEAIAGFSNNINDSRIPFYLHYMPGLTSVKNMAHWAQGYREKTFAMYDYGSTTANLAAYNQPTPPQYQLQNFPREIPVALFTGSNDVLADPADVQILLSQLPVTPYVHNEPTYAHIDFIWATDAVQLIYPQVLSLLSTYAVPPEASQQRQLIAQNSQSAVMTNTMVLAVSIAVPIAGVLLIVGVVCAIVFIVKRRKKANNMIQIY